jgi:DNA-binding NarL/FixJ family response regulator
MVRVLIADAYPVIRRGIRRLIEAQAGWQVCAEAADGPAAVELAIQERPDVAVLDVGLPVHNGMVVLGRLRTSLPETHVLLFSAEDDEQTISSGLASGARGYLLKGETDAHLVPAINALVARRSFFSPTVSDLLLDAAVVRNSKSLTTAFTGRELEVMQLVCEGRSNRDIAGRLGLSVKTIETHRGSSMRKAGARTAGQLVRFAMKNRLVQA